MGDGGTGVGVEVGVGVWGSFKQRKGEEDKVRGAGGKGGVKHVLLGDGGGGCEYEEMGGGRRKDKK